MVDNRSMVTRNIEEFDKRQGGLEVAVSMTDTWLLFPNGATRQTYHDPSCPLNEPPDDEYERQKLITQYKLIVLNSAIDRFQDLKRELMTYSNPNNKNIVAPPVDGEEKLKTLKKWKKQIEQMVKDHEEAEELLEELTPPNLKRSIDAEIQDLRTSQLLDFQQEVESVELYVEN